MFDAMRTDRTEGVSDNEEMLEFHWLINLFYNINIFSKLTALEAIFFLYHYEFIP